MYLAGTARTQSRGWGHWCAQGCAGRRSAQGRTRGTAQRLALRRIGRRRRPCTADQPYLGKRAQARTQRTARGRRRAPLLAQPRRACNAPCCPCPCPRLCRRRLYHQPAPPFPLPLGSARNPGRRHTTTATHCRSHRRCRHGCHAWAQPPQGTPHSPYPARSPGSCLPGTRRRLARHAALRSDLTRTLATRLAHWSPRSGRHLCRGRHS